MSETVDLLRHALATLAYRGGKAMRGAPESFAGFHANDSTRTPLQIVTHMGDLMEWSCFLARGEKTWKDSTPQSWEYEVKHFFDALQRLDQQLASQPLQCKPERLFQGPIADALTHVGQIAILRRIAGVPVRGENFYAAEIVVGRVGNEQAPPKREF